MTVSNQNQLGALYGLGAALLFGLTTPFIKLFLSDTDLLPLAGLLYVGAGVGLGFSEIFFTSFKNTVFSRKETSIQQTDLGLLSGIILTGGILGPILMLYGLQRISAVAGSLLMNLEAPLTILLAITLFREHLGKKEAGAALCVFAGAGILSYSPGTISGDWLGAMSISAACACWALDNNLTQRLSHRNPLSVTKIKGLGAGSCALGLSWMLDYEYPDSSAIFFVLGLGFVGYGISVVLDMYALRLLGAAREAAYFSTAPFIGAVAAVPILGEGWTMAHYAAATIMALGVWILMAEHHRHMHAHVEMVHNHVHTHADPHHTHNHEEEVPEAHAHVHRHVPLHHDHAHVSDLHHRHEH